MSTIHAIANSGPATIGDYEVHEDAGKWDMGEEEYAAFAADIKRNGLNEPIWLCDGRILDGRHRLRACLEGGIEPRFREYTGDDPAGFTWSENGNRRHWSPTLRGIYATEWARWEAGENQHQKRAGKIATPKSRDERAAAAGISSRTLGDVQAVMDKGIPELVEALKQEKIAVSTAAGIARQPEEVQQKAIIDIDKPKAKPAPQPKAEQAKPSKVADSDAVRRFSVVLSDAIKAAGGEAKHVNSTMGTVQFKATHDGRVFMVTIEAVGS